MMLLSTAKLVSSAFSPSPLLHTATHNNKQLHWMFLSSSGEKKYKRTSLFLGAWLTYIYSISLSIIKSMVAHKKGSNTYRNTVKKKILFLVASYIARAILYFEITNFSFWHVDMLYFISYMQLQWNQPSCLYKSLRKSKKKP